MFKMKALIITAVIAVFSSTPLLASPDVSNDEPLAQVGNLKLTHSHLTMMIELLQPQMQVMLNSNPELKKELIKRWVEINLLAQEAISSELDKDPLVKIKINEMKNRILVESLIAKRINTQAVIPQDEVSSYYEQHESEFEQGEQVHAQHILIRVDENNSEEDQIKAQETMGMIEEKLKKGESFSDLAQQYSEDPGSRATGGNLGYFGRGQMVKEFEEAAFATAVGETSKPIQTSFGWHLIHVIDKKSPEKLPLEQVNKQIEAKLRAEKNEKALQNLLEELKGKYPVTIK